MFWAILTLGALAEDARRLQSYGGCPHWENSSFSDEPSPFGWPLTPNDWSPWDLKTIGFHGFSLFFVDFP